MALSGSFYNYPVKSFGLYCEWSASQSVTGNYSNVTLKVYLSYWDLYVGARDDGVFRPQLSASPRAGGKRSS